MFTETDTESEELIVVDFIDVTVGDEEEERCSPTCETANGNDIIQYSSCLAVENKEGNATLFGFAMNWCYVTCV